MVIPLVSGIIGAGAATAVILDIIFVIPQLASQQQTSQTETESPGQQQQERQLRPTQQQSPSTNDNNNNNNLTTAQTTTTTSTADPWQQLRHQDPVFDNFYTTINECVSPPLSAAE